MAKSRLSFVFALVIALFASMMLVSAAQSFTISPTSVSETKTIGDTGSGVITIENTGNESLNVTISKENLLRTGESITLSINATSYIDIAAGATRQVEYTYDTTGTAAATFDGSVTVVNTQNSSQTATTNLTVITELASGASLQITNHDDGSIDLTGDIDEREDENLRFRNNGNITLNNFQFDVSDLVGISDEIESNDIDFDDEGFDLEPGDSQSVEMEIDIPSGISEDTYEGTLTVETDEGNFEFIISIEVTADDIDVVFDFNGGEVRDGVLEMVGEEGELIDDYEFIVDNDGEIDLSNLRFELDGDLEEEFSSNTIAASRVTFSPSTLDLDEGEDDNVEVRVDVPDGQTTGNYYGDIQVLTSNGRQLDELTLKVRIIGDIFISSIDFDEEVSPGDTVEVDVVVKNQESRLQRNVRVSGTLFDVDSSNSDISETTSSFILDVREEKTQTLRFKLPEDATDGGKTLEITVDFEDGELTELEEVQIVRPDHKISIESYSVNPGVVVCEDNLFTLMRIKNLGRFDEDVRVTAEIQGQPIIAETGLFELEEDDITQRNLVLDVSSLEPGTYTVEQRAIYSGVFEKRESLVTIARCGGADIDVKPIEDNLTNETIYTDDGKVKIFGSEVEPITIYLGTGIGIIFLLIVVALFLL